MPDEHRAGEKQSGGDLDEHYRVRADRVRDDIAVTERVHDTGRDVPCERLEAEGRRGDECAEEDSSSPPLLPEPAEERPGDEAADDDERVADEKAVRVRERVLRSLRRAVGHEPVAEKGRTGRASPKERAAARRLLRAPGEERDSQ